MIPGRGGVAERHRLARTGGCGRHALAARSGRPSLPTNAASVSPAAAVENAFVVTAPWPVTATDWSTVGGDPPPPPPPPLEGTVTLTGTAVAVIPFESVARALSVWLPGTVLPTVQA